MPAKGKTSKTDTFIVEMDSFAKDLLDLAKGVNVISEDQVPLLTRLDVFRQLAQWVSIKNRLSEADPEGDVLDGLRNKLRKGPPGGGTTRGKTARGGNQFGASWAAHGSKYPDGDGGSALEAIKRALPRPDAGDDGGAGDGAEC